MPIKIISKKTMINAENFHPRNDEWINPEKWYYQQLSDALKNEAEQVDVNLLMQKEKDSSIREAMGLISDLISDKDITVRLIVPEPEKRKQRSARQYNAEPLMDSCDYGLKEDSYETLSMAVQHPSDGWRSRPSYDGFAMDYEIGKPFSDYLLELIDERNLNDTEVYKRANMDRRHFSKIRNSNYHPSKKTALALAIALKLDVYQTNDLLEKAGYILSRSSLTDQIVRRNIEHRNFDINDINIELFDNGLDSLG